VALYRVHFKWKEKEIQLQAKSLDLTHPYFVSIKDLVFPKGKSLIINPSEDDTRRAFGEANHLMIPFQSVSMIEELPEDGTGTRVMPFELIDEESTDTEEPPTEDSTDESSSGRTDEV
jgi:hypothetical protein